MIVQGCALCNPELGPLVSESEHWRLVVNREQSLLGKCFLALKRHEESITDIRPAEWSDLHEATRDATERLYAAFGPDHLNYAFLGNVDRHVHLHVLPRYAEGRDALGRTFTDRGYPGHYALDGSRTLLNAADLEKLAAILQGAH